jgi:hypothetical protein
MAKRGWPSQSIIATETEFCPPSYSTRTLLTQSRGLVTLPGVYNAGSYTGILAPLGKLSIAIAHGYAQCVARAGGGQTGNVASGQQCGFTAMRTVPHDRQQAIVLILLQHMSRAVQKLKIQTLIEKLSANHPLRAAAGNYRRDFVSAVERVYPAQHLEKIIQHKFFIPDDSGFDMDKYLQSAAELSVQNDLKQNAAVKNFEIDKKVNPPKDVEAHYVVADADVALEVKCAKEQLPDPNSLVLKSAGRVPGFDKTEAIMKEIFRESKSGHVLETDKNKDNTMKDFLLGAHAKFSPQSSCGNVNILIVACGNIGNMNNWYLTLYGSHELFTSDYGNPEFYTGNPPSPSEFELVDVVILSNLKYLHTEAREYHDWTLKNAILVPLLNPHGRRSLTASSFKNSLSAFDHHYYRFNNFVPKRADPVSLFILKLGCYYLEGLDESEKAKYFPVQPPTKGRPEVEWKH